MSSIKFYSCNQVLTENLKGISECHIESFPFQFLSRLGFKALTGFYNFHRINQEIICIALNDNFVIGFIQGGKEEYLKIYRMKILRENLLLFIYTIISYKSISSIFYFIKTNFLFRSKDLQKKIPDSFYYLSVMAVNANYRGRNISIKLLKEFENKCIERGYEGYYLNVSSKNHRAIAFYMKQDIKVFSICNQTTIMIKSLI